MIVQDSHILNPLTLLYQSSTTSTIGYHAAYGIVNALPNSVFSLIVTLAVTIASISLCSVIAMYFYRPYQFSGFGYLLGLPTGFAVLGS